MSQHFDAHNYSNVNEEDERAMENDKVSVLVEAIGEHKVLPLWQAPSNFVKAY